VNIDLKKYPNRKEPWLKENKLNWRQAVGCWLYLHSCAATGTSAELGLPPLPEWFTASAITMPMLGEQATVDWLRKESDIPAMHRKRFDLKTPMDWCVARLIERYQLPWHSGSNMKLFILTEREESLKGIVPYEVLVERAEAPIGEAFTVTITSIDEYTTKQQWDEIYEMVVRPNQDALWEKRGDFPHSKQIELENLVEWLRKPWVIEFCRLMAEKKIGVDRAIEHMSLKGRLPPDAENIDRSTLIRLTKRLNSLWKPI
jgi:hypothetical protein